MAHARTWLRSPRFDAWLQLGALAGVAPALALHAGVGARASSLVPLASLIAIPFLHVFASFFFAFSTERNVRRRRGASCARGRCGARR